MSMLFAGGRNEFDLALALIAFFVLPIASIQSGRAFARDPSVPLIRRYVLTLVRGITVSLLIFIAWRYGGREAALLGLDWPIGRYGQYGLLFVAAAAAFLAVQVARLPKLIGDRLPEAQKQIDSIKILPRTRKEYLVFLAVAVNAGIWEELLYRGFLMWYLTPWCGLAGSVVLSSLVFGIGHLYQGRQGLVRAGIIGLAFAAGYAATNSLWWLIAAHALLDLHGGTVAFRVAQLRRAA